MASRGQKRKVCIDLDANTDCEDDAVDENPPSELISNINSLDSDDDFDVDLIEEIVFEDEVPSQVSSSTQDINEVLVKRIEDYLKDDSFHSEVNKFSKKKKKSKARKKLIADLTQENTALRQELADIKERFYLKVREVKNLRNSKSRIICFRCGEPAVLEFMCCWNGCYCSRKCREVDWFVSEHFKICLKPPIRDCSQSKTYDDSPVRGKPSGRGVKRMKL